MAVFTIGTINRNCKIEYKVSPLFEMMACLRSCYLNKGLNNEENLKKFYNKNEKTIIKFYGNFEYGAQLAECILGLESEHTFQNFFNYLKHLNKEDFLYYLLGRYINPNQIKDILKQSKKPTEVIKNRIEQLDGIINDEQLKFIKNFDAYYNELINLWIEFYEEFFYGKEIELKNKWKKTNRLLDSDFSSNDFNKVISKLLTGYNVPEQFPTKETRLIRFYPSKYVSPKFIVIWGLGELNIVYDMSLYLNKEYILHKKIENKLEEEKSLKELSETAKSLSELGRLKILSLIANSPNIKAQEIAKQLNITTATVSRHINMLKQNNVISERKEKAFNIYTINQQELESFFNDIKNHFFV